MKTYRLFIIWTALLLSPLIVLCQQESWDARLLDGVCGFGSSNINAVAAHNDTVYLGHRNGSSSFSHISAWSVVEGTWDHNLGGGLNDDVHTIAVYDNLLLVGGKFTEAGGEAVDKVAIWDGSSWSPMGDGISIGVDGTNLEDKLFVHKIVVTGSRIFALVHHNSAPGRPWCNHYKIREWQWEEDFEAGHWVSLTESGLLGADPSSTCQNPTVSQVRINTIALDNDGALLTGMNLMLQLYDNQ